MNQRIEVTFAPVDGLRHVTEVAVADAAGERVLFDIRRPRRYDLHIASVAVERLLKTGTWRISFPEMLDRAPVVYGRGVSWRRLVAFRTDLTIEEVSA